MWFSFSGLEAGKATAQGFRAVSHSELHKFASEVLVGFDGSSSRSCSRLRFRSLQQLLLKGSLQLSSNSLIEPKPLKCKA